MAPLNNQNAALTKMLLEKNPAAGAGRGAGGWRGGPIYRRRRGGGRSAFAASPRPFEGEQDLRGGATPKSFRGRQDGSAVIEEKDHKEEAIAYRNLGSIAGLADPKRALEAYEKAVALDPDDCGGCCCCCGANCKCRSADMTPYFQFTQSPEKSLYFRALAPRRRIGDNQRRQTPGRGARTAADDPSAGSDCRRGPLFEFPLAPPPRQLCFWEGSMRRAGLCSRLTPALRGRSHARHSTCKSSATSSLWRCVSVLAKTDFN